MSNLLYIVLAILAALLLLAVGRVLVGAFLKYRGKRLVTCPEIKKPQAVQLDALHAALTELLHHPDLRLRDCTRWPERENCGQACLRQIAAAPDGCLVRSVIENWYRGKACADCGKPFGTIHWHDHPPALLSPEKKTILWNEVPAPFLPAIFQTHLPICWDCHIAETLRRLHPELITYRDPRWFEPAQRGKAERRQ